MKYKTMNVDGATTFAVVFDPGDDAIEGLKKFAQDKSLSAAQITAVGAFQSALLGYFDFDLKDYKKIRVDEQVEVLSFLGDIARQDDQPSVHIHVVLGKQDGSTIGGHLLACSVRPTLEVILRESLVDLRKTVDPATGLALIDL